MTTHWINIAPLISGHEEELAADIRRLRRETAMDSVAFICTLVPEGDPPFDKAAVLAERFARMKALLADCDIACGILLQATMGHGWVPDSRAPFQKVVTKTGEERYIFCPLGDDFLRYVRGQIAQLAATRPDFFMLDDDTRLISGRSGCFCPRHLAEMEARTGRRFTRETLADAVQADEATAAAFDTLLKDSILTLARTIRGELDKADPALPCSFCCCRGDVHHAAEIASALAAPGQELVIRLNNGRYLRDTIRDIPRWLWCTAKEVAALPPSAIVLDEPDTCPQNRYSMGATALDAHVSLALLEGCRGGKFWITRTGQFEPASGEAYRRVLARRRGFHLALADLAPAWEGVRIPLPSTRTPILPQPPEGLDWGSAVLGRFGIASYNSRQDSPLAALSSDADSLTDAEIESILSKAALLDGRAAEILSQRGFSRLTGVEATAWDLPVASLEIEEDGTRINSRIDASRLSPVADGARILSRLHHRRAALDPQTEPVAPGLVFYENPLGGRVATFAARLPDSLSLAAFYFYNETRKRQLLEVVRLLVPGGVVHYPGDGELLVRAGKAGDGRKIVALCNLSLDPLETIDLVLGAPVAQARQLGDDGEWRSVGFAALPDGATRFLTGLQPLETAVIAI